LGRCAADDLAAERALRRTLVSLLLVPALLLAGCNHDTGSGTATTGPIAQLDKAVAAVTATRGRLLDAVDANQRAASALDATDELCVAGNGTAARASFRASLPLTRAARLGRIALPAALNEYRRALGSLQSASPAVKGAARTALSDVVRDGGAEADAVQVYLHGLSAAWPQYDALSADQDVWTSHAVSGWYRTRQEGAAAYAVQVEQSRAGLQAARTRLSREAVAVRGPISAQSETLRAANRALQSLR
jgi:hypothetical protein